MQLIIWKIRITRTSFHLFICQSSLQFSSSGALWKTTFMVASVLRCIICFVCGRLPVCIFRGERQKRSGALSGNSFLLARRGLLVRNHSRREKQIYSVICCIRDDNLKSGAFPLFAMFSIHLHQLIPLLQQQYCSPFKLYRIHDARRKLHILFGLNVLFLKYYNLLAYCICHI